VTGTRCEACNTRLVSPESTTAWPRRMKNRKLARARFGESAERLVPYLERADPLADAAVAALAAQSAVEREAAIDAALSEAASPLPALAALVASAYSVPPWLDEARLLRANEVFLRAGLLGGITLGLCSLVYGYAAPAGNKPLAFSGRLTERADRRLAETGKFVTAVTEPDGLRPGALGWRSVLRVRLMHAQVRRLLLDSGRWSFDEWSQPINQADMLATILLFSCVFIDGIRKLGVHVTAEEADDYQHLFRYVGVLIGVEPALLPTTHAEAMQLAELIRLTQGAPDEDSRELVRALIEAPARAAKSAHELKRSERQVAVARGICRGLIGDELADALGLPRDRNRHLVTAIRFALHGLEKLRRSLPPVNDFVQHLGSRYWDATVRRGLQGVPARYELPQRLARA
jgi:ER-bound oxygenase mpaB/B'/Rubber oxygenase, catalytic domain